MTEPHERLQIARKWAGYESAAAAARAMDISASTYRAHENDQNELSYELANRYSRFFKVRTLWLLEGTGDMEPGKLEEIAEAMNRRHSEKRWKKEYEAGQEAGRQLGIITDDQQSADSDGTSSRINKPDKITEASVEFPKRTDMPQDVPVWGSAAGSQEGAFVMNVGEAIDYVRRPPGLVGKRDVFGIYVQGESMEPKFEAGELLYMDPHRPPRIRDYVVVVCQVDGVEQEAYVGRLSFRQGSHVALEKFNPSTTLELKNVKQVLRVITSMAELFGV